LLGVDLAASVTGDDPSATFIEALSAGERPRSSERLRRVFTVAALLDGGAPAQNGRV